MTAPRPRRLALVAAVAFLAGLSAIAPPSALSEDEEWLRIAKQGAAHYELSDYPQAARCWERAIQMKPGIYGLYANLSKAYYVLGRYREALALSLKSAELPMPTATQANVRGDIGLLYKKFGMRRKALEAHLAARDLAPDLSRHWFNSANALSALGRREEAIAAWQRCIELKPVDEEEVVTALADERVQLTFDQRPPRSEVTEVAEARTRMGTLDLEGAREVLSSGRSRSEPARKAELVELEARASYLDSLGAPPPGTLVTATEAGKRAKVKRASSKGLEVEGESALVPWRDVPWGAAAPLVSALDRGVSAPSAGQALVLYDLGLWGAGDRRLKAWIDADPSASARAFEILARYRGLASPPPNGFVWKGSEWLTPEEDDVRTRDLVSVDGKPVTRAEARQAVEKQRATRRAAKKTQAAEARAAAEKQRAERGVVDVRTIVASGDVVKRSDVVVISDGFTRAELAAFERLADLVSKALLTVEPFQSYARYVNVHRVSVAAEKSGIDGTRVGASLASDTKALTCDPDLATTYARFAPDADLVIVCANVKNARATGSTGIPGGPGLITIDSSGEFNEVVLHELGHAIAGLDDEYTDEALHASHPDYDESQERAHFNTTRESNPKRAKWHYWLLPPALAKDDAVGCIEGGWYRDKGYFRPARNCRMRTHATKKFCAVCLEQLELSFYSRIEPIDDVNERAPDIAVWKGVAGKIAATAIAISPGGEKIGGLSARWTVDDKPAPAGAVKSAGIKTELNLAALKLSPGPHEAILRVDLRDTRVRRDGGLLSSLRAWRINVSDAAPVKIVAPDKVTAVRGEPVVIDISVEGGTPDATAIVRGPPGSTVVASAERGYQMIWCPPRHARGLFQVTTEVGEGDAKVTRETAVVLQDPERQVPPVLRDQGVLVATRGKPLVVRLEAFDADGDGLVYTAKKLLAGATIDANTGVLRWTPGWSATVEAEIDAVMRVSDGIAEDELALKLRVESRPVEASGDAFDVLLATRARSTETRKAAFEKLMGSDLPRGGKLLELARLLRDADPEIAAKAREALGKAIDVSELSTRGLVAIDLSEQSWKLADDPEGLAFLKKLAQGPLPKEAQAAGAKILKEVAAVEAYNKERGK